MQCLAGQCLGPHGNIGGPIGHFAHFLHFWSSAHRHPIFRPRKRPNQTCSNSMVHPTAPVKLVRAHLGHCHTGRPRSNIMLVDPDAHAPLASHRAATSGRPGANVNMGGLNSAN